MLALLLEPSRHDLGAEMLRQKHALAQACIFGVRVRVRVPSSAPSSSPPHPSPLPSPPPLLTPQALLRWPHVETQLGAQSATLARLRAYVSAGH